MTYCVAMSLHEGMLFASDSRTNAGVDNVSTFSKMNVFEVSEGPNQRCIVAVNAGNLATTQGVVSQLLRKASQATGEEKHILNLPSMFDVAEHFGQMMKATIAHVEENQLSQSSVDFTCTFLVGGQIGGEAPRLFLIYPQGNFIEATSDTPYFQIGESKYGKPIIDRVVRPETPMAEALKSAMVSFDSTMKSNLSVGLPIDVTILKRDQLKPSLRYRVTEDDAYFQNIRKAWGQGLRQVFQGLPQPDWFHS
jgi:putative proteasome-type protease